MLSSSIQASLTGRYEGSQYGISKLAAEELLFEYGERTGSKVLVYRFPNLFGKWCRPNYNSVVATFCYNLAHDLPVQVNDPEVELELLYIDDLVNGMIEALKGQECHCEYDGTTPVEKADGRYCYVPQTYKVKLGELLRLLEEYKKQPLTLVMPELKPDSFEKKLFSTYLSYLPKEKCVIDYNSKEDDRGSFTELIKTINNGQISVNISKPGITKGQHWHNSKWELFIVVKGKALIQERKVGSDEIYEFEVSGDHLQAVYMLPGYTHNIINLSDTEELITLMWANEVFDEKHPDTFALKVEE